MCILPGYWAHPETKFWKGTGQTEDLTKGVMLWHLSCKEREDNGKKQSVDDPQNHR